MSEDKAKNITDTYLAAMKAEGYGKFLLFAMHNNGVDVSRLMECSGDDIKRLMVKLFRDHRETAIMALVALTEMLTMEIWDSQKKEAE